MSGFLPQSETELQRSRPGSNRPGSLPQTALLGAEKVVYEDHPRALSLHPVAFWVTLPIFVFFALLVAVAGSTPQPGGAEETIGLAIFLVVPPGAVLLWAVGSTRSTTYALTDQRVVLRSGSEVVSLPYSEVGEIAVKGKSKVIISTKSTAASTARGQRSSMVWRGVRSAPSVVSYAQSATQFYQLRLQQRQIRQDLITSSMEEKILCQYCGGLSPLSKLNPEDPRCPRCTAPIVVAPIGIF